MKSLKKIKITMHGKERIAEEQILKLHQEISLQQKRYRQFQAQTQELLQALIDRENQISRDKLKLNSQKAVSQSNQFPPFVNQLNTNSSAGKELLELIQIGQTKEEKSDFNIPIVAPWIGEKKALIITAKNSEQSCYFLNALILQIILQMPRVIRFTLLDPHTQGLAFPIQNHITPWLSTQESDLTQILNLIKNDISNTISTRLDKDIRSYEQLPKSFHTSDPFEIIVLANYPKDFRKEDFEQLQKIAQNGPVAGKYLIIQQIQDLEQDKSPLPPEKCHLIDLDNLPEAPRGFRNTFTAYPQQFSAILSHLSAIAPKNEPIPYTSNIGLSQDQLWQKRAAYNVKSPIGNAGHDTHLELTFGDGPNGFLSAHAVWAGTTGAGKSSGYHTLICGLAQRYSPHELNFYLVDGKNGVEFQPYQNLPHARTVILHSQPELSRSVLKELILEMEHRNEIFAKSKVTNLRDYHLAGQPLGRLPRLLLIADEYQEFFDKDKNDEASQSILKLSKQGRSAGIHMLLGSQGFTGTGLHGHSSVMGNFHTRIAMRMVGDEINSLSEFGPNGRELIKKCDKSGKSVINAHSGDDTKNQYGTIAYITKEEISKIVEDLTQRSNSLLGLNSNTGIDGMDQPSLGQSPTLKYLIKRMRLINPIGQNALHGGIWVS